MTHIDASDKAREIAALTGWAGLAGLLALLARDNMEEMLTLSADMALVGDVPLLVMFLSVGICIPMKMYR